MESSEKNKKKKSGRGPGRPPTKKPHTVHYDTYGIVDKPSDPENKLELCYENPKLFAKLIKLCKDYNVHAVLMIWRKDGLEILMNDFTTKSKIFAKIHGKMMIRYYCEDDEIIRCIKRSELEKILKNLDNCHTQIIFTMHKEDYNSKLHITVKDSEIDMDNHFDIDFINKTESEIEKIDDKDYPIRFEIASKKFKKIVGDIYGASQTMTIRKDSNEEPLVICYENAKKINYVGVFKNPEVINLKCNIDEDDIFSATVGVSYIKPFSNSNIGEKVFIAIDKFNPISFTTYVDNKKYEDNNGGFIEGPVCTIKIFTDIQTLNDMN